MIFVCRQLRENSPLASGERREQKMNINIEISQNIGDIFIQVLDSTPVNHSDDVVLTGLVVLSIWLILGVNSTIIK